MVAHVPSAIRKPVRAPMITTIRRLITSKVGAIVALLFLVIVGLSFALSDVSNTGFGGTSVGTGNVAKVGDRSITVNDLRQRLQAEYARAQQQQPGLTMQQFVAEGGLDRLVKAMTDIAALEQYAVDIGMGVSPAAVDAIIARDPAFAGINGNFDQATFEARLAQQGRSARDIREEIAGRALVRQLLAPVGQLTAIPQGVTLPYASLLLEQRVGQASFIPASSFAPTAAPTDAVLTAYYNAQRARYSVPERRAIRFAILDSSAIRTVPTVTPEEIAAEYRANAATYAAREIRRFAQVIAPSREAAQRIAAAAQGNNGLQAAAAAAGLQAAIVTQSDKAAYAAGTSTAVADAAFAASEGGVVGPLQVPLGFIVVKVTEIETTPARTLATATSEITTALRERKRREALDDLYNGAQEALNGGATVDEVARDRGLTVTTTPPLLPNGSAPGVAGFRPDPLLPALLGPAFQAAEGDPGQIIPLQENEVFALVDVTRIIAAAPPPLAEIRARVLADWRQAEGAKAARARARQILAAVERGQALPAAAGAAGLGGSVQTIGGRRIDITRNEGRLPPEIALLFSMAPGTAKTLEMPGNVGWMVIKLDRIVRGDASGNQELLAAVQGQFQEALGSEYVEVLVQAARAQFPVTVDSAAVDTLRAELTGTAPATPAGT
jgi:peptidyl-prolyl cis-trans isomerase D